MGRASEKRFFTHRLAGRRIDPVVVVDVAQVPCDRVSIA
jgi:hypothetical protein